MNEKRECFEGRGGLKLEKESLSKMEARKGEGVEVEEEYLLVTMGQGEDNGVQLTKRLERK
jgi:hypothetical protein